MTINGTITNVSGEYEADATSFRSTMLGEGESASTEQRYIDQHNYFLDTDGLWYSSSGDWIKGSLVAVLGGSECPAHTNADGTATVSVGQEAIQDLTNSLGLTDDTFSTVSGTAELTIGADRQPQLMDVNAVATQTAGSKSLSTAYQIRFTFDQTGSPPGYAAPAQLWVVYQDSTDYGYIISIPEDWTVTRQHTEKGGQFDEMVGNGEEVQVWGFNTEGATADAWFKDVTDTVSGTSFLGKLDSNEPMTLGGAKARLLTGHIIQEEGTLFAMVAVVYVGDHAFDFIWYSAAGLEDMDRELFLQMMGTLVLMPD
jgi:hypothetical protein